MNNFGVANFGHHLGYKKFGLIFNVDHQITQRDCGGANFGHQSTLKHCGVALNVVHQTNSRKYFIADIKQQIFLLKCGYSKLEGHHGEGMKDFSIFDIELLSKKSAL